MSADSDELAELKTISQMYDGWWLATSPTECGQAQLMDMRRAYFSGFFQCLHAVRRVSTDHPEAEACAYFQALHDECAKFFDVSRLTMEGIKYPEAST